MSVPTYTKSGTKAATPAKLNKTIFGLEVKSHQLLKDAYLSYQAGSRQGGAKAKTRGDVRGGGRKPWRQKGTGNARFGSSRNPIWRGGGAAFGPTGEENFNRKLSTQSKRQALKQALSLAAKADKIKVIENFTSTDGKSKSAAALLSKIGADNSVLLVVAQRDPQVERATRNLASVKTVQDPYLSVFEVLNADQIIITKDALQSIDGFLGSKDA